MKKRKNEVRKLIETKNVFFIFNYSFFWLTKLVRLEQISFNFFNFFLILDFFLINKNSLRLATLI